MRFDSGKRLNAGALDRSDCAVPYETGNPLDANSMAGRSIWAHGFLPYFCEAYSRPRTVPGTPDAR